MTTTLQSNWLLESNQPEFIQRAGEGNNQLLIWHRPTQQTLIAAVASLPFPTLPDGRLTATIDEFAAWLDKQMSLVAPSHHDALAILTKDMVDLAHWFDRRWQVRQYTFRCHRLADTMCPRFHTDYGSMRLLCTYRGPGTEWVPDDAIDHQALRTRGTKNSDIVKNQNDIQTVPLGSAAILCGSKRNGVGGVVHRSPAVNDNDGRFTFCMTLPE